MATSFAQYKQELNLTPSRVQEARKTASKTTKSKKGSGNQSFLSSIISELGGAGGAAGGAAAGAALGSVVPGIGNIVGGIAGGIIGGFGGGTAGRLVENKVRDNEYRLGDALKEGAVSGAIGAVGPTWQAARGLSALGKAGGSAGIKGGLGLLGGMTDDTAKVAGKAIVKSGAKAGKAVGQGILNADDLAYASRKGLQSAGGKMRGVNRGIVAGNSGLTPDDVVRQNKALDSVNKWFSGVGKSPQIENVDDAMKALSNTYKVSGEGARKFGQKSDAVINGFLKNLDENQLLRNRLTPKAQKLVSSLADDVTNIKTDADFVEFMSKKINPLFRDLKNGNPGSVDTQIYEAFRKAGKSVIDEKMATRSGINKQFANLMGATESLGRTVTRDAGAGASQGLTLGRIAGNLAGGGMDIAGRAMQQAGKVTKYTTPLLTGAISRGAVSTSQPQEMSPEAAPMQDPTTLPPSDIYQQDMSMQDMGNVPQAPQESIYPLEQAIADYQAAPNAKAQKQVMEYYDFISKAEAAQNKAATATAGGPNITKVTGQQYVLASRGANAVQQLAQLIQNDPGVINRLATPGRKLPIVGGSISRATGTGDYDAISYNVANALLRLETGAQANPEEIKNLQTQLMPRAGDSPETIQIKLQQLQEAFSAFLNTANGQDAMSGANDLSSLIQGYGGM